mmetsp:Transcript_26342/g.56558  ORF Transcript_26342/g.56558 Transcript_26342/m.56558 type:complete len:111 (-) Transcript_26342:123-455(-)
MAPISTMVDGVINATHSVCYGGGRSLTSHSGRCPHSISIYEQRGTGRSCSLCFHCPSSNPVRKLLSSLPILPPSWNQQQQQHNKISASSGSINSFDTDEEGILHLEITAG